jgi:hypothetical protein
MSGLLSASNVAKLACVAYVVDAETCVKYDDSIVFKILLVSLVLPIILLYAPYVKYLIITIPLPPEYPAPPPPDPVKALPLDPPLPVL